MVEPHLTVTPQHSVNRPSRNEVPQTLQFRSAAFLKKWWLDLLIGLGLLFVAWFVTRQYLNNSLLTWGDHPGQFMRFWYPLFHVMPDSGHWLWGILGWNPTWYAGYPEIQFYPPGTTLLGIALYYGTLGRLTPEQIYNALPAVAFALPLFTCYAFLRNALAPLGRFPSIAGGLVAAYLALSLKPMWGGIDGVMIGLMGERLAFGFAPFVLLCGWLFVEKATFRRFLLMTIGLAFLSLLHPFHAPAVVVAVTLYAILRMNWRRQDSSYILAEVGKKWLYLVGWVIMALALVAWWVVPLVAHYSPYAAALVRATPDQVISWFDAGKIEWLWLASLMSLMLLASYIPRVEATVGVMALLAPLLVAGILFNDQILVAQLKVTFLDPIRFIAEYYLALIFLVGSAVAAVTSRFLWRIPWLATICTLTVIVTLQPYLVDSWSALGARIEVSPLSRLDGMRKHPAYLGFWEALQDDPTSGRILFTSYYQHLASEEGVDTPTTVNSLTPYLTGREIIGGTFSHWSPIARWLWVGDPQAKVLPAQVETADDRQIFGKSWDNLSVDELVTDLRKLNVTTVVVGPDDEKARTRLESSPHFSKFWSNDYFNFHHLKGAPADWIEANGATATLQERTPRKWVVHIEESDAGATILLKMATYPLWRAQIDDESIPIVASAEGLQVVSLPAGGPYDLTVTYREGVPEWAGLIISLVTVLLLVLLLMRRPTSKPTVSSTRAKQS